MSDCTRDVIKIVEVIDAESNDFEWSRCTSTGLGQQDIPVATFKFFATEEFSKYDSYTTLVVSSIPKSSTTQINVHLS